MPTFTREGWGRPKTHGRWTDANGVTHALLSGEHDGYYLVVNQRAVEIGAIPPGTVLAARSDIELKFAVSMRRTWEQTGIAPKETIVINKPEGPCTGRLGCDGLLNRFLPPGGELTVHWPGGNSRTYRGGGDQ
jgi:hypothetical protein